MRHGLAAKKATGARLKIPFYLGLMADLYGRAGHSEEALDLVEDALARVEATGERWFEAELHRIRGELLLSSGTQGSRMKGCDPMRETALKKPRLKASNFYGRCPTSQSGLSSEAGNT
jgi:predicted ATPase